MGGRVPLVGRQFLEDSEFIGRERFLAVILNLTLDPHQVLVEPAEGGHAEFGRVLVRAGRDIERDLVGGAVKLVDPPRLLIGPLHAVERKDPVGVAIADHQGPRRDQGSHQGVVPAESVDEVHAVAVPLDAAIDHMVLQVGDARHGYGGLDAVVNRRDPPAIRASAGSPGHTEPLGIDLLARLEVVERPDAVPGLDAGRRVAAVCPPPHAVAIGSVVNPLDLAELEGVDHQAGVAVACEPHAVVLIAGLVAVAHAVLLHPAVAANVENCGDAPLALARQIEVAGDVQPGPRLEVQLLDNDIVALDPASDRRLEIAPLGQRIER